VSESKSVQRVSMSFMDSLLICCLVPGGIAWLVGRRFDNNGGDSMTPSSIPAVMDAIVVFCLVTFGLWVAFKLKNRAKARHLLPDDRDVLRDHFVRYQCSCAVCGAKNWKHPNHLVVIPVAGSGPIVVYPVNCVSCQNCIFMNVSHIPEIAIPTVTGKPLELPAQTP